MSAALEATRREWEEGHRRLQAEAGDPLRYTRLLAQVEAITDELRRRIGQTFTLAELAEAYAASDRWSLEAVEEHAGAPGWPQTVSLAAAAAFFLYQRGATDYRP